METTTLHSFNTVLKDRTLWFDGQSSFKSSALLTAVKRYDVKFVDELTPAVREYNGHVSRAQELKVKTECLPLSVNWVMPDEYKNLNVLDYVLNKHDTLIIGMSTGEISERERRLASELVAFETRKLLDVVRALIYTINTLTNNNVVWGVGRGSSVSSYVMYVIGVHDVDSFKYDLNIDDFLHD